MADYFSLFEIPFSLSPDKQALKQKFYALSKAHHPDRFTQSSAAQQIEVLQKASLINQAYKALTQEDKLIDYVLKKKGVVVAEEAYKLPQDFLMEMMDLNEEVTNYEEQPSEAGFITMKQSLEHWMNDIKAEQQSFVSSMDNWDADDALWAGLKDLYYRKKYLLRIQQRINTFAARP